MLGRAPLYVDMMIWIAKCRPRGGLRMSTPETATLGSRAKATITAAARAMYPHDALPDDVYARVGEKLAEAAREDCAAARTIEDGVSALNGAQPFAGLAADEQIEALKGIEGSDFFELVRSTAVAEVYPTSARGSWSATRDRRSTRAATSTGGSTT